MARTLTKMQSLALNLVLAVCLTAAWETGMGQGNPAQGGGAVEPAMKSRGVEIRRLVPDEPVARALRPVSLTAGVINLGDEDVVVSAKLSLPEGVRLLGSNTESEIRLGSADDEISVSWEIEAAAPTVAEIGLELSVEGAPVARQTVSMRFLPAVAKRALSYIPEPVPAPTEVLVGAHYCPLWESDKPQFWSNVLKHPERTPALGFYSQDNPEVADWEIKWAVEHGISFFVYCWYRDGQGGAVRTKFGSAIHDGLFKAKFADKMKFTLMWENQERGKAGVSGEADLMENLLPFWMENYFQHPGYLKVDNKPVLFIYRPEFLVKDLGSVENVAKAFEKMRHACREAGFDGLHLLGEYRGTDPEHLAMMKSLGLDYTFAYCWYLPDSPAPDEAIKLQMDAIRRTQELNILPQVVTVSQAWSGWTDAGSIWKIPPPDFERLLRQAREFTATLPKHELGSRMLLLDNWNEWGEGHYIAPYREHGFGYLDAVRNVFSTASPTHEDLLPEDAGVGPYDTAMRTHLANVARLERLMERKVVKPGAPEGLVGWWTFDEETGSEVAHDVSGHRLGGAMGESHRMPGWEGNALLCVGSGVTVPDKGRLSDLPALTIECRVKTESPGQDDRWMMNRIFGDSPSTGFRLGLQDGKPSFQIPLTPWSHQMTASEPLPLGRWVHLAATYDGEMMRLYMDGSECGAFERAGKVGANGSPLVLGNYEVGSKAHFIGLLDDVRLYRRALTSEEIRENAAMAAK
jgi:hypothetical protein